MTEEYCSKCTNITTIYNKYLNIKYLQKLLKMPSKKAWVQRPSGLIKMREKAQGLVDSGRSASIKVENVL